MKISKSLSFLLIGSALAVTALGANIAIGQSFSGKNYYDNIIAGPNLSAPTGQNDEDYYSSAYEYNETNAGNDYNSDYGSATVENDHDNQNDSASYDSADYSDQTNDEPDNYGSDNW